MFKNLISKGVTLKISRAAMVANLAKGVPAQARGASYNYQVLSNKSSSFMMNNVSVRDFSKKLVAVKLPDLGEGTKEATIKEWYVQPGSRVEEFDDLVEVFTDKLVAKIPSTCTGIVKEVNFVIDDVCLVGH